jgi:hypothetical protein
MPLLIAQEVIDDPFSLWRRYARNYPRTIREYDLGGLRDPDTLTEAEAWRSPIINSRLTRGECDEVVRRAQSAPCASVPAAADLVDADASVPGGLFADTAGLYWSFTSPGRIKGVAVAKVHKILHLKRPGLYPILDERVKSLHNSMGQPAELSGQRDDGRLPAVLGRLPRCPGEEPQPASGLPSSDG